MSEALCGCPEANETEPMRSMGGASPAISAI